MVYSICSGLVALSLQCLDGTDKHFFYNRQFFAIPALF